MPQYLVRYAQQKIIIFPVLNVSIMKADCVYCAVRSESLYISPVHFRRVRKIANSHYWLRHVSVSVRPHGASPLPVDGLSYNFVSDDFLNYVEKIEVSFYLTRITGTL